MTDQPETLERPSMVECAGNALESKLAELRAAGAKVSGMEMASNGAWRLRVYWPEIENPQQQPNNP